MNDNIKKVVVDAGHGGVDSGAVNGNIYEKNFNLEVAKYIYDRLKQLGVPVYITRDTDETLDRNERVNRILNAFGNSSDVIVLSNHINAGGGEGAEVVYALRNDDTLAKSILEELEKAGQKGRKYYQRRLPENPSKDYYFIQRLTGDTESLLIEYGFIDNKNDLYKLQNNLLDYGEAVVKAVANYIGVPYVPVNGDSQNIYVVQRGDSLYSIAQKYNTTVQALKSANNLTSNTLQIGQKLILPDSEEIIIPNPSNYTVYTVKRGDTLYKIATEYGITPEDIIDFNKLNTQNLVIGQQLLIPISNETPDNGTETISYTVQDGDSLWKIANTCSIDVNEIIRLNNLETTIIRRGDILLLPASCNIDNNNQGNVNQDDIKHVVARNDTLYSIARKYGTTVNEIMEYNLLPSTTLTVGQILYIPNTNSYINYYVQPNDTLYSIARENNTTVDAIKSLNNLTSNVLRINQLLLLPR